MSRPLPDYDASVAGTAELRRSLITVIHPIEVCILSRYKRLEFRNKALKPELVGSWIALSASKPSNPDKRAASAAISSTMEGKDEGRKSHIGKLVGFVKFRPSIHTHTAAISYPNHPFTEYELSRDFAWPIQEVLRLDDNEIFKIKGTQSAPGLVHPSQSAAVESALQLCLIARSQRKAAKRKRKRAKDNIT